MSEEGVQGSWKKRRKGEDGREKIEKKREEEEGIGREYSDKGRRERQRKRRKDKR